MRVIASDESHARRLTTAIFYGTSPRGEQSSTVGSRRSANEWIASEYAVIGPENRNNEGWCDRFVKAEKSEEWMARSPVWADDVIASETALHHQPMNWRDSIWVQTSVTQWAFPMHSTQRWVHLWKRTRNGLKRLVNKLQNVMFSKTCTNGGARVQSVRKICAETLLLIICSFFFKGAWQCDTCDKHLPKFVMRYIWEISACCCQQKQALRSSCVFPPK